MADEISLKETNQRRLLAIFAHPDDESFGPGGSLALYTRRGVEVHLICATRGEAGSIPPGFQNGYPSVADLREAELRCAASHLGLAQVHFLGYRDSGMTGSADNHHPQALIGAPIAEVAERITAVVRSVRPQVLITFDPIGGYRHPDHIAIHRATKQAFHAAGDPAQPPQDIAPFAPQKVYYHTFRRETLRSGLRLLRLFGRDPSRWGRNRDINLLELVDHSFPIHAEIDFRSVAKVKEEASNCHRSQLAGGPPTDWIMRWLFRRSRTRETFTRAYPPAPDSLREKDLFEGVIIDGAHA